MWVVFVRLEPLLKDDTRNKIASWVRGSKHGDADSRWPATVVSLINRIFGGDESARPKFNRSCVASLSAVVIATLIWRSARPVEFDAFFNADNVLSQIGVIFFGAQFFNFLPDFLSLLQSRYIVQRMGDNPSLHRIVVLLLVDLVLTALIGFIAVIGVFSLLLIFSDRGGTDQALEDAFAAFIGGLELARVAEGMPTLGVFFYSTFFTSVWVWLYAFSGIAVRLVYRAKRIQAFVDKHFDVATRPLSVMGAVLIVAFTIVYWPAIAIVGGG